MPAVPENPIPFSAFREDPSDIHALHVLERRPMLRFLDDDAQLARARRRSPITRSAGS